MLDVSGIMKAKIPQAKTVTPSLPTKSAYQQLFSQPTQQEWKLGDQPTNYGQALATINNMAKTDQAKALEKLELLNQYRTQPGNMWYDPFASATNRDVDTLKSYGIDPTTLTDDWFNANNEWQAYLRYNGTTNTPSKPTKKSTDQEKLSYALYQFKKSMGDTTAAKNEWAAAQDEINYWVNRKDLNLSDDDIINRVFGSNKYKTLGKMDSTRTNGSPLELNEAIDYNPDSVRGVIWAARNGGGTGNSRQDIANYYSKAGNMWRLNSEIAAKLDKGNQDTYSPHEIGMTGKDMDAVGAYFGKSSFAPGEIESLRKDVDWNDATSVKMFQTVYDAEQTTLKAEEELALLDSAFEGRLKRGFASQEDANKWLEDQLNSGAYNTLVKMDNGLNKGDPINLTRAVPYRKQLYQQKAADAIANPKKNGSDVLDAYGVGVSDATKSTTKVENETFASSFDAMATFLTQGEKDYFNTVPGVEYNSLTAAFDGVKKGAELNIGNVARKQYDNVNGEYSKTVLGSIPTVTQYEQYKDAATRLNNKIIEFEQAHRNDLLTAADVEPEVNVTLSDGTTAHLVYDPVLNEYDLDSISADSEVAKAEIQQIITRGNQRLRERSNLIYDNGEATPEMREQLEQYKKGKEQLNTLYKWLEDNSENYLAATRAVDEAKIRRDTIGEIAAHSMGQEYDSSFADSVIDFAGAFYNYESPQADGVTLIDEIYGAAPADVKKAVDENNASIKDLQFVLAALGDNVPEELQRKINTAISDAEKQNRLYSDYLITDDPQFKALADKGRDEYLDMSDFYNVKIGNTQKQWFPMMSTEEVDIYFALAARDGVEVADQFYADLRDDLQTRLQVGIDKVTQRTAEKGALDRFISEAGAILLSPLNTMAGAVYSAGVAFGADPEEINILKTGSHISQSQHQANVNAIKETYKDNPALSDLLSGIYEIMYNRGNSLIIAVTLGKFMPSIEGGGKIAEFFSNVLSATPIALSAASDALENAIERGANPTQQAIIFASTLMAESWTEGIEFGHIEKAGKMLLTKEGITTFLKGYLPEAFSELLGETANDLIENAADNWVSYINNPDYQNQHDLAVKAAMAEDDTLTPEQAEALVHQAEVDGVLHTAIISFFSPGADVISIAGNTLTTYYQYAKEAHDYNKNATGKHAKQKSIRDIRLEHEAAEAAAAEAKNNPQPVEETPTTAPAQETTNEQPAQQTSPVFGPDETRMRSYAKAMNQYDANIILLEEASGANATTQAAAVAAALNIGDAYVAQAAAAKLNIGMVQAMMYAGRQANINMQTLAQGLQYAALGNGECARILNEGVANGLTATEMAGQIAAAAEIDANNLVVQNGVVAGVHDARVNETFKKLMAGLEAKTKSKPANADEAMERLTADKAVKAVKAIDDARALTKSKEEALEQKQNELIAAQNGIKEAAYEIADNPNNNGNHLTAALEKITSTAAVVEEYRQALENARQHQQEVESENLKLAEETTANLRQQAENSVREQEAAEAQAKAEAEAQAAAEAQAQAQAEQRQMEVANENRLDADAFIEEKFPNISEEEKEKLRQQFNDVKQKMGLSSDAILARGKFEKQFAKKFGLNVRHVDYVEENGEKFSLFNARIDQRTGELLVNKNTTQNDIFYAVLIHEITHLAEQNEGAYAELADAVLQMQYGNGVTFQGILDQMEKGDVSSRLAQDILGKKGLYDERLGRDHTNKEMLQEIVADEVGKIISGDEKALNNLVAEKPSLARRLLDGIRNFLNKMMGMQGEVVTQAQKVADMLEKALNDKTNETINTIKEQYNGTLLGDAADHPVERFSMSAPVEVREDGLIATHNLSEAGLISNLKMGGIPMASIAVRADKSTSSDFYGDITLFFGMESVDPKQGNRMYVGDAWTPTLGDAHVETLDQAMDILRSKPERNFSNMFYDKYLPKMFGYMRENDLENVRNRTYRKNKQNGWTKEELADYTGKINKLNDNYNKAIDSAIMEQLNIDEEEVRKRDYRKKVSIGVINFWERMDSENSDNHMSQDEVDQILNQSLNDAVNEGDTEESVHIDFARDTRFVDAMTELFFAIESTSSPRYAEVKSDRVTSLNEILAAEVPNTVSQETIDMLKENGIEVYVYDPSHLSGPEERRNVMNKISNNIPGVRFSLPSDEDYLAAVNNNDIEAAQKMVDQAAENAGYNIRTVHGTNAEFNTFEKGDIGYHFGTEAQATAKTNQKVNNYGGSARMIDSYIKMDNPLVLDFDAYSWDAPLMAARYIAYEDHEKAGLPYDESETATKVYKMFKDLGITDSDIERLRSWDDGNQYFDEILEQNGYDGIIYKNEVESNENAYSYIVPLNKRENIKVADPVTYDDNGNVIPLSQRFNEQNEDIRYSLSSPDILKQQIQQWLADNGLQNVNLSEAEARDLMNRLPNDSKQGDGVRQWAVKGAQSSDELDSATKNYILNNRFYKKQTNAEQLSNAIKWIHSNASKDDQTGYHNSLAIVMNDNFDYASGEGQARMLAMIGMAAAANDTYGQVALSDAYLHQGSDLGRAMQARKMWILMTPEGRKRSLKNMVDKLNIELQTKSKKGDLKFSDWIYEAAGMAENEGEFDRVRMAAKRELAEQLPANWKDRMRSFRMLCMLANPRTHVRNVLGNMLFMPAVSIKNKLGAVAELGLKQGNRTKTLALRVDSDIRAFARQDANNRKDELTGDSRWKEGDSIKREQKAFTGKFSWLQKAIDANSAALEWEDWKFLKGHYARALGGWMQANGYSVADMENHPEWLEKGRAYAQNEAQKATYRDFNAVANKLNQLSREGGFWGFVVDATLPFKKTPANIVKRGLEYSVVGLAKSLSTDLYHLHQYNEAKKNGAEIMPEKAISPNEFIDHFCSGLTGTAVMALGAFLSSLGIITVGLDDDDDKFEKAKGGQEYALKVKIGDDDVTYTLDWAAPMCMPFFVGAQVYEQLVAENHNLTFADIVNDISSIAEPVFNLSMLDGVNSLLRTSNYDNATEIMQIVGKIASNYATSYVPALFGTLTRIADPYRRKAFVKSGEGTGMMGAWRYAWEQTENKVYWAAQTNIPYRNIWGEPEGDTSLERHIENLISPGYKSTLRKDPIIDEMERLYSSEDVADTRKSALIPKLPAGKAGGEALEPEQYDQFTVERGQTAKKILNELLNSDFYKTATDNERATMIGEAWDYATQIGSNKVVGTKLESWVANSRTNPVQGIINRQKNRTISDAKKDWKAEAINAVQKKDYEALNVCIEALNELGVSRDSVKTAIGNAYKPAYIEAYQTGNRQKMIEIESILDLTGLGFDKPNKKGMDTYDQWIENMNKQIAEDEEDF